MYNQNCIHFFHFYIIGAQLVVSGFFFTKKYFTSGINFFVVCNKNVYQTPLSLSIKKMYKMI